MKKMMGLAVLVMGLLTLPCAAYAGETRITGEDGIIRTSGSLLISGDEAWRAIYTYVYSNNNYSGIVGGRRARGSSDSRLAVMAGDYLFWLNARGHDGNSFSYWSDAAIGFIASENFDTSSHGTFIAFYTTTNGSNSKNEKMRIADSGNVGIGTTSPNYPLQMASGAHVTTGGVWTDASSRDYKENIRPLTSDEAKLALTELTPSKFNYKVDKNDKYVGFIAEDVPDLVATKDRKGLSPMDIVAVLTKVVQEQEKRIEALEAALNQE